MRNTIDGLTLDIPLIKTQVIALAQHHHKLIDDAIFHQEIHLGEYGLKQKFKVAEFTKELSDVDRENFYEIYNAELNRLAKGDDHHAHDEPETGNISLIILIMIILAVVIYSLFIHPMMT